VSGYFVFCRALSPGCGLVVSFCASNWIGKISLRNDL